MTMLTLLVLSVLIFLMLLQMNGLVGLLFFLTAIVSIPAVLIQRREAAAMPEPPPPHEAESMPRGMLRLAQVIGADTTGIALGVLWVVFTAVLVVFFSRVGFR